jgi:hypothetical protein
MGGGRSKPFLSRFTPGKRPGTYYIGAWVGPRAGLDGCEKFCPSQDSIPGRSTPQRVATPATLYRPTWMDMSSVVSLSTKNVLPKITICVRIIFITASF